MFQSIGWDVSPYSNITSWIERCKTLPGADENESGAKIFGNAVLKNLKPGQL